MLKDELKRSRDSWADARPVSELLPWLTLATDGLVLCKDGGLFAVYEMRGADLEGRSPEEIDQTAYSVEKAMKALDDRHFLSWISQRNKVDLSKNDQDAAIGFAKDYNDWLGSKTFYQNRDFIVIGLKAESSTKQFFGPLMAAVSKQDSWGGAIRKLLGKEGRFTLTNNVITQNIDALESDLRQFHGNLAMMDLRRLQGDELISRLNTWLSPASDEQMIHPQIKNKLLDTELGSNTLEVRSDALVFHGPYKKKHLAVFTLKEWPSLDGVQQTNPEMLSSMLSIPAEYTLVRLFKPLSADQSRSHVQGVRRLHIMKATSLFNHLRKAMSSSPGAVQDHQDPTHLADADEASEALNAIGKGQTGWLSITLMVHGTSESTLESASELTSKQLIQAGVLVFRENMHSLSAWAGTLPGNLDESVRFTWATGANAADASPIITLDAGEPVNKHLSEQAGRQMDALATFSSSQGSAYWFNFHHGDLGHSLVIGPSGSGKSVMMNFLITRWQSYAPCQTYIFDKDKSCYVTTLCNQGQYLNPADGVMRMNPMANLKSDQDWDWFLSWLEILLTHRQSDITPGDDKALRNAVEAVRQLDAETRRLKSLALLLPGRLAERLAPWIENGQHSRWFDHSEDSFDLGGFVTLAMDDLFRQPSVARAFLEYAFFRINRNLTGKPTLIYLEEAWFALSDPLFAARIENWLRTLRKKNAIIIMASQNLDELARSEAFAAISDNMPTRLFLANPSVESHIDLYTQRFGLRKAQLDIIRQAVPKHDYLVTKPSHSRLIHAQFPPRILARLRSDQLAMQKFAEHEESGRSDYIERYVDEMVS